MERAAASPRDPRVTVDAIELRRVCIPLVAPFRTSSSTTTARDALILRVLLDDGSEGWGECGAEPTPHYTAEYAGGAADVLRRFLAPALFAHQKERDGISADEVAPALALVQGHQMAKAALEMGVLDASLRLVDRSFAQRLGAVRDVVECGVAVGIQPSIGALLDTVGRHLDEGYLRIKLKVEPGHDVEPVRAARERFGDIALQVDANASYAHVEDPGAALRALDAFALTMIEQPLAPDDLAGHAALAHQLGTPICLDESITSANVARQAVDMGACSIVNIKAARVGGYLAAIHIHDLCAARGVPVWCGGLLETGLGRAANVALAALPNFTLPGDTSASARYFAEDLTEPFVMHDGRLAVPTGPGLGVSPRPDALRAFTTSVELLRGY